MINLLFSGVAIALLLAAGYWIRGRGGHRPAGTWAMAALLLCFALAFASYVPIVQSTVERIVPQVARLLSNSFALAAATSVLAFMYQLNLEAEEARRRIRRRVILLTCAIAGMTALFTAEQMTHHSPTPHALYVLIYITYLGYTARDFLQQTWEQSKRSRRASQRTGLRITAAGCGFALLYAAYKVFGAISLGLGLNLLPAHAHASCTTPVTPVRCTFSVASPALAVLFITVGLTLPAVIWPVSQFLRRRWERRSFATLGPLWHDITTAAPEVVLDVGTSDTKKRAHDFDFLLHRRVIEINDGILALRPYRPVRVQQTAERMVDASRCQVGTPQGAAIVEAAVLTAAVRTRVAGGTPPDCTAPPAVCSASRDGSLRTETEWLLLVAHAYAHSETVSRAVTDVTDSLAES